MKLKMLVVAAAVALAAFSGFSPGLTPKAKLTFQGEYDLATNAPSITVYHWDQSWTNLGTGWTNQTVVMDGDVWVVDYPVGDCNTNASIVVLNGYYTLLETNGVPLTTSHNLWLRMSPGMHKIKYQFHFNKFADGALTWDILSEEECVK